MEMKCRLGKNGSHLFSNFITNDNQYPEDPTALFSKNSVLYFPPNRFEEPAWLNEENLTCSC